MKLRELLRSDFAEFIRPLLLKNQCEKCGDTNDLHLHHVKLFHELMLETLSELSLEYNEDDIMVYSENELSMIRNIMLGKQLKIEYKTLCNDCHKEEHRYDLAKKMKASNYVNNKRKEPTCKDILISWILNEWDKKRVICSDVRNELNISNQTWSNIWKEDDFVELMKSNRVKIGYTKHSKKSMYLMKY